MENFFQPWNADHKIYILAMLCSWVLVPFVSRKYLDKNWQTRVALCLVISILGVEIIDDIYRVFDSKGWFASSDLPLHMCGFSVFTTSWALLTKDQLIFELSYFWGLGGAIQAILTPDPSGILNHFDFDTENYDFDNRRNFLSVPYISFLLVNPIAISSVIFPY